MIGRLRGSLLAKNPPQIVIDVNGIGYEVDVPMSTFYNLPECGQNVNLHTHFAVREDGHFLYGFATEEERIAFRQLIKVSGIGARTALAILSGLSVSDLAHSIAAQDSIRLIKVPGIGKKTAERLLLELRDKFAQNLPDSVSASNLSNASHAHQNDTLNALIALGYNEKEALAACKQLAPNLSTSDAIRQALKQLSKI